MARLLLAMLAVVAAFMHGTTCGAQQKKEVTLTKTPAGVKLTIPGVGQPASAPPTSKPIFHGEDRPWSVGPLGGSTSEKPDAASEKLRSELGEQPGVRFGDSYNVGIPSPRDATQPAKPVYALPAANDSFGQPMNLAPFDKSKKLDLVPMASPAPSFEIPTALAMPADKAPILQRLLLQGRVVQDDKEDRNHLTFGIIGIQWNKLTYPTIMYVFPGTPAETAGLQPNDVIMAIDGISLANLSTDEVTTRMIDTPGTSTILSIQRAGKLSAAVIVRMDVDDIKDPAIRAAYGRSLRRPGEPENAADYRF